MRVWKAGAAYFGLVFAAGFLLGPVREFWAIPMFGATGGLLLEAVVIVPVIVLAARWCADRFSVEGTGERLRMGAAAFVLLLAAELAGSMLLRGMSVGAYFMRFGSAPGAISLALFVLFAAMPAVIRIFDRARDA
ncbi:hypothetical protein [Parvibaculum sp.]|jgi:hypothetical protein|uniref:hypothetical protein n=1 Tax=Parvibaculum sp. TaxID=2024848 RepID=UPI001B0BBCE2|nr:hypothetical protein [Parvibaculum sp.]MBO6636169.1 hypothetical protein [Parvibaculum sp.]MBO6680253.1 hypothetical protein [Parvibaculum sp.]MBO6685184.1 hypothetical protein [Parvibaculum sp.]MBO6905496.1 hypothetical protein [Parvibaculum sp.]